MGCLGEPSALAKDLHGACINIQGRVRHRVRPGVPCRELLVEGERAVRENGGTPATVAVLDGQIRVGLSAPELERLAKEFSYKNVDELYVGLGTGELSITRIVKHLTLIPKDDQEEEEEGEPDE